MEKAESDTLGVSPPAFAGNPRTNAFSMASVTALPFNPLLLSVANSHTDSSPSSTGYEEYGDVAYGTVARAQDVDQLKAIILAAEAGTGEVARAIQDAMFTPRHNAFTSLLQLASKSRQPEKAVEIFEAMRSVAGIEPNTYSYSALISALARVGNWQDAEKYFHELKLKSNRDPAMRPNTVTYAALISAYEKGRQLEKALATFAEQVEEGIEPDVITYASLLGACERAGDIDQAVAILDSMHTKGLAGPQPLYNSIIAACGPRWNQALETFLGMQCAGVGVSSQTVNLLMASMCAGGQRDHALWLLRQAGQAGLSLSTTSYISLLSMLSSAGDWKAADAVFACMRAAHVPPDSATAGLIVEAHARGGDEAGATQLSVSFKLMGIVPDTGLGREVKDKQKEEEKRKEDLAEAEGGDGITRAPGLEVGAAAVEAPTTER